MHVLIWWQFETTVGDIKKCVGVFKNKIKTAARVAVAAMPRTMPRVQASLRVTTAATSYSDYSGAWLWLWSNLLKILHSSDYSFPAFYNPMNL